MTAPPRTTITLFAALRHANLGGALAGMVTAGLMLGVLMFFSLRAQVTANLDLIARTIAYSTEAALMFNDTVTTQEILAQIAQQEKLAMATVINQAGEVLAHTGQDGNRKTVNLLIDHLVFPSPTEVRVVSHQQILGRVSIRGNGEVFALFFLKAVIAIVVSLLLTGVATLFFTRKAERSITRQLDTLAKNTLIRRMSRAPGEPLKIAEFQQIDTQFRDLLAELDAKTAELVAHKMSLEDANASLSYQANHDELTDLGNRAYFNDCLARVLARASTHGGMLAILYMDSDHFKKINDQYGHAVGDLFLVKTAQSIQRAVRRSDTVARLGGDEFAVLLAPLESLDVAQRVAEKILATPDLVILDNGKELVFKLSISIGIAIYPDAGEDSKTLLKAADRAMYTSKKSGGGCYSVASSQPQKGV
ncbi:MAG: diguanylate cyclase [Zoogloeaceae bacterium]|jgi:diguanylate cyclase (GGDEF)-like protein|nr:diguanylate cyclase [Zoogloeaceae bacterium]